LKRPAVATADDTCCCWHNSILMPGHQAAPTTRRRHMGHVCRICERTIEKAHDFIDFSTVLVDLNALQKKCLEVELDLRDSFNAFCFTCRQITMSVPAGTGVNEQMCYLQSQVNCFQQLKAYHLVV
jgi:tryptophanyl-tRNA synthetase